jgi:hypothetical protein
MVGFIQRLNAAFTDADKEACLPVIEQICEVATTARSKGLLALDKEAASEENIFLRMAMTLVADAHDTKKVKKFLQHLILGDNHSGAELLSRLIILVGVLEISKGANPRIIREFLLAMLGEKYLARSETAYVPIEPTTLSDEFNKKWEYEPRLECRELNDLIQGCNMEDGKINWNKDWRICGIDTNIHDLSFADSWWEFNPTNDVSLKKIEHDYYPHGRIIIKGGKAKIFISKHINTKEVLAELCRKYKLIEPKVRIMDSKEYECYVDRCAADEKEER